MVWCTILLRIAKSIDSDIFTHDTAPRRIASSCIFQHHKVESVASLSPLNATFDGALYYWRLGSTLPCSQYTSTFLDFSKESPKVTPFDNDVTTIRPSKDYP